MECGGLTCPLHASQSFASVTVFYREAARERRRPRRQSLQINRSSIEATMQAKHFEWWQYSQLLPARAPALPGRFAVVQSQIFYSAWAESSSFSNLL